MSTIKTRFTSRKTPKFQSWDGGSIGVASSIGPPIPINSGPPIPTFNLNASKVTSVAGGAQYTSIFFGYVGETVLLCIFYVNNHGNTGKPSLSDDAGNIYTEIDTHIVGIGGNPANADAYLGLYSATWDSVPTTVSIDNGSADSISDTSIVIEMSSPLTLQDGPNWISKVNGDPATATSIGTTFNGFSMGLFVEFVAADNQLAVQPDPPFGNIFIALQNTGSTIIGVAGFNVDTFTPEVPQISGASYAVDLPNGAGLSLSISFEP